MFDQRRGLQNLIDWGDVIWAMRPIWVDYYHSEVILFEMHFWSYKSEIWCNACFSTIIISQSLPRTVRGSSSNLIIRLQWILKLLEWRYWRYRKQKIWDSFKGCLRFHLCHCGPHVDSTLYVSLNRHAVFYYCARWKINMFSSWNAAKMHILNAYL